MSELWAELFSGEGPMLYAMTDDGVEGLPAGEMIGRGERAAAGLARRGVEPGTRVACIITNSPQACASVTGIWLAGGVVVSVPIIARATTVPEYQDQLRRICEHTGAPLLLVEARFAPFLEGLGVDVVTHEELPADRALALDPPGEDDIAFVQYSSGSTREPRGCALTTSTIAAQLDLLSEALALDPERDRGLAWLPLSHDMGFFGAYLNFWRANVDGMITAPERFLGAPRTWLDDCAEFGATLTVTPALGLGMAARAARGAPPAGGLGLRACIVGGDLVHPHTLDTVDEVLGPLGLGRDRVVPAYGLAEATLAVTMSALGEQPHLAPAPGAQESQPPFVSAGRPLRGVELRIEGDEGVGEILVRSPSLASGYFEDEAATAEAFAGGELRTGDLGFLSDGELYVVGRADDVIKVGARKVWATEVEAALAQEPAVRAGNCALVLVPDSTGQRLVVLAEPADESGALETAARRVGRRALEAGGIGIGECVFLARGSLPKTPSGKVQRYRCRQLAREGGDAVIGRVALRDA